MMICVLIFSVCSLVMKTWVIIFSYNRQYFYYNNNRQHLKLKVFLKRIEIKIGNGKKESNYFPKKQESLKVNATHQLV